MLVTLWATLSTINSKNLHRAMKGGSDAPAFFIGVWLLTLLDAVCTDETLCENVMGIVGFFMKRIYFGVMLVFFYTSSVCAESWVLRSVGPVDSSHESRWEIREDGGGIGYFLLGQDEPVYVLHSTSEGSQIVLENGMTRRFGPGFLLLMDLPLPIFLSDKEGFRAGEHCFQEHLGKTAFQSCVNVKLVDTLEQARSLPKPQSDEAILVTRNGRLEAIIGSDFQAERVEDE